MRTELQQQQHHRRVLSLSSAVASDRDDDLTLFRDMQRKEQEHRLSIAEEPGFQTSMTPLRASDPPLHRVPTPLLPIKSCGSDDILASDWDKSDYNWLMTPPSTPLFLNVDRDSASNGLPRACAASARSILKPSKFGDSNGEISSKVGPASKNVCANLGLQNLSANSAGSKPSLTTVVDSSTSRPLKTSTQNCTLAGRPPTLKGVHMSRLTATGANTSSRVSHSHSGAKAPAFVSNGSANAMTPSVRSAIPHGRSASASRPSTPLKQLPSPHHPCNPPTTLVRCASANRAGSMMSKGATISRASSPTMKAWSPDAFNGMSLPNLRMTMQERPTSFSKSSKTDQGIDVQNRRKSGSLLVTKEQTAPSQNGGKKLARNDRVDTCLATSNGKVAERAMGVKKPVVFSKEGQASVMDLHGKKPTKAPSLRDVKSIISSVRESSGLGRNALKKSSDLSSRHMDTGKSTPHKFRSFMSSMAKSSLISKKSGSNGAHSASSVSDSPMATSSNASSEHNMSIVIDPDGSELGDEGVSERESRSSAASQHDFLALGREKRISSWLRSPEYKDDDADIMQIFEQEGLASLSSPESPLFTELDGTIEFEIFCLDPI
ncbi:hypothetical protein GOP47_0022503 [Adiantum capillus-veneris]|uniref:Uncharacterized protein n=1 Tax=Adiantum capillus-veneris TaxID=13818 RepID=A0A9D4U7I1_ADICA|nr:hypothetical protein GOP47_0022503 [Adiantum capillus-veneris]